MYEYKALVHWIAFLKNKLARQHISKVDGRRNLKPHLFIKLATKHADGVYALGNQHQFRRASLGWVLAQRVQLLGQFGSAQM